jgi:hypothetical protein
MRTSEEIDVVGIGPRGVAVIGECRWRREPMDVHVLDEVREFKLPAVRQSGARVDNDLQILLFARAGYTPKLKASAAESGNVRLVELSEVVGG